jgi:hypothetical protein
VRISEFDAEHRRAGAQMWPGREERLIELLEALRHRVNLPGYIFPLALRARNLGLIEDVRSQPAVIHHPDQAVAVTAVLTAEGRAYLKQYSPSHGGGDGAAHGKGLSQSDSVRGDGMEHSDDDADADDTEDGDGVAIKAGKLKM